MKEENLKILEMLQNGTITVDEANKLLQALSQKSGKDDNVAKTELTEVVRKRKMLKILVDSDEGDKVNISIPVEFAKLLKSGKISSKLSIDDTDINIDEVISMAEEGVVGDLVNIKSKDGETVKIFIE